MAHAQWNTESFSPPRVQLIELLVFLFLILPSLLLSFSAGATFAVVAWLTIFRDLALLGLVLYFVWRSGEGFGALGWRREGWVREALIGVALFVPTLFVLSYLGGWLQGAGFSIPQSPPAYLVPAGGEVALALVLLLVVAVAEETIFRGYLILRLTAVTGSSTVAAVLATILFAFGHGYEGAGGAVAVGFLGLVFAFVYLWRRSLVAPMVMHFLQDLLAVVALPLLGHH